MSRPPDIYELIAEIDRKVRALTKTIQEIESDQDQDHKLLVTIAAGVDALLSDISPPPRADELIITWDNQGDPPMPVTLQPGESRGGTVSATAQGAPSTATLSALSATMSDPTFSVTPDPASPNNRIIVTAPATLPPGLQTDAATVTVNATATEPDGVTTESVSGVDTVTVNAVVPPPPPPADGLGITWDPAPAAKKH